ncbi:hypothetical protein NW768_007112 [Fusarium equiseti]|uniref:Uncharacterized protein n=1 Tax=Fusarium equiseti TaxID=61235 RepID=A0ABQ8RA30_FUSEQ|nr:hypothetical protein NW768_007112 [Fusarium equiseti]
MPRPRPSSKKRRKAYEEMRIIRELVAKKNLGLTQNAHAASAQSSTTPSGSDPSGSNHNFPAPQVVKPKCKHRHLPVRFPNRHYYAREDKYDHRFFTFLRRSTERMDNKIAEMTKVLNIRNSLLSVKLKRYRERLSGDNEQIRRDVAWHVRRIEERSLPKLLRRVDHLENRCNELSLELMRERQHRRMTRMGGHTEGNVDNVDQSMAAGVFLRSSLAHVALVESIRQSVISATSSNRQRVGSRR